MNERHVYCDGVSKLLLEKHLRLCVRECLETGDDVLKSGRKPKLGKDENMGIGTTIRNFRKERRLTLQNLSEQLGVSCSFLSAVEREVKKPSLVMTRKFSDILNISPTYLFRSVSDKTYGEKLRYLRCGRGLSIGELGELSGISVESIRAYEQGIREPNLVILEDLAKALRVSVRYFLEKSSDSPSIGARIRREREKLGLTGVALADKAGISPAMVSQVENGQVDPSLDTLENVSKALGVTVSYFLSEQDDVENLISCLNKEVLVLLSDPRVQAVLRAVHDFESGDLNYVLNYIQFFKRNRALLNRDGGIKELKTQ